MKVLKVIVDKPPEGCGNCKFLRDAKPLCDNVHLKGARYFCNITGEPPYCHQWKRPDWCPLILKKNVMDWVMNRNIIEDDIFKEGE